MILNYQSKSSPQIAAAIFLEPSSAGGPTNRAKRLECSGLAAAVAPSESAASRRSRTFAEPERGQPYPRDLAAGEETHGHGCPPSGQIHLPHKLLLLPLFLALLLIPAIAPAADQPHTVVDRGPHSRVWQGTREVPMGGRTIQQTRFYTELATGLNYQKDGQWLESKEVINVVNGMGVADQGQIQIIVAPNINTAGVIDLLTPDNKRLRSHLLCLAFTDGTGRSVIIADTKDSIGTLIAPNIVLYQDAFTDGIKCDVRYTYKRASFEQDILLLSQLPAPQDYGLDAATTRFEIWTEFLESPNPIVTTRFLKPNLDPQNGVPLLDPYLSDDRLDFGVMSIGHGSSFPLTDVPADPFAMPTAVAKTWAEIQGRRFLIEKIDLSDIAAELAKLPRMAALDKPAKAAILAAHPVKTRSALLASLSKPARATPRPAGETMRTASVTPRARGLLIDYSIVTSQADFTFQADSTYFIPGQVILTGNTVLEGNSVIKSTNGDAATRIWIQGTLDCRTGPYRPSVFTGISDDTIGEPVDGSTGNAATNYCGIYLSFTYNTNAIDLHDVAFRHGYCGIYLINGPQFTLSHAQFTSNWTAFNNNGLGTWVRNVLVHDGIYAYGGGNSTDWHGEQLTCHRVTNLRSTGYIPLTNSLVISVTNASYVGDNVISNLDDTGIFQTVGAAAHYLAANSPYRNSGTNVSPPLAAQLAAMTTYPPIIIRSNGYLANTNLVLSPQAQRDTDTLDIGYHYYPLDFIFGWAVLTNSTIVLTNGVAIGTFSVNGGAGLLLEDHATLISEGFPTNLNRIVRYNVVQEQANKNWSAYAAPSVMTSFNGHAPQASFRFTDWSLLAQDSQHFYGDIGGGVFSVDFKDCQFHGGGLTAYDPNVNITNCLFERVVVDVEDLGGNQINPTLRNCTFYGGTLALYQGSGGTWTCLDNLFDKTAMSILATPTNDYNGYITNNSRISTNGTHDVILGTSDVGYQTSWLGRFYLPTNSVFIDKGSVTNAALVGFYHLTTLTNQTKEFTNKLDIGFHTVAVNTNGFPFDTDADGIPDYQENAGGNNSVNSGETDWQNAADLGLKVLITRPKNNSTIP